MLAVSTYHHGLFSVVSVWLLYVFGVNFETRNILAHLKHRSRLKFKLLKAVIVFTCSAQFFNISWVCFPQKTVFNTLLDKIDYVLFTNSYVLKFTYSALLYPDARDRVIRSKSNASCLSFWHVSVFKKNMAMWYFFSTICICFQRCNAKSAIQSAVLISWHCSMLMRLLSGVLTIIRSSLSLLKPQQHLGRISNSHGERFCFNSADMDADFAARNECLGSWWPIKRRKPTPILPKHSPKLFTRNLVLCFYMSTKHAQMILA